jgi:hypothetical protein
LAFALIPILIIIILAIDQFDLRKPGIIVPTILVLVVSPPVLAFLLRNLTGILLDYKSLQSHLDSGARSRKLRKVLPSLTAELLSFRDRLVVLALYMILLPLEPFYGVTAAMKWALRFVRWIFSYAPKRTRHQDPADGPREGIEMA